MMKRLTGCIIFVLMLGVLMFNHGLNAQGSIAVSNPFTIDSLDLHTGVSSGFLLKTSDLDNISNAFILDTLPGKVIYDAQVASWYMPSVMQTGQQYQVSVTMQNTGTATWQAGDLVSLGAVDGKDDFALPQYLLVALSQDVYENDSYLFELEFLAPMETGWYTTEWQMLKQGQFWFGEIYIHDIEVVQRTAVDDGLWQLYY